MYFPLSCQNISWELLEDPRPLWHLPGKELSNSRGHESHCIPAEFCPLGVHLPRMWSDQCLLLSWDQKQEKTLLHRAGLQDRLKHSRHLLMCRKEPLVGEECLSNPLDVPWVPRPGLFTPFPPNPHSTALSTQKTHIVGWTTEVYESLWEMGWQKQLRLCSSYLVLCNKPPHSFMAWNKRHFIMLMDSVQLKFKCGLCSTVSKPQLGRPEHLWGLK